MMAALGILATLAGCSAPRQLSVDNAWVRLGVGKDHPGVAYFTLHGGATYATLINVTTDVAIRTEMHASMQQDGITSMAPLPSVAVPAGTDVAFKPGGRHVMLFYVNPGIKPGGKMTFTYTFSDGTRILYNSGVVAAGDAAPQ